jgi:DNA polymerase-3 subunit gamma/tau
MVHLRKSIPIDDVLQRLDDLQRGLVEEGAIEHPPGHEQSSKMQAAPLQQSHASDENADASATSNKGVLPSAKEVEKDTGDFMEFVRRKDVPMASILEHGTMQLSSNDGLVIAFPAGSFFLDQMKDPKAKKKIQDLCEAFFQKTLQVTIAATVEQEVVGIENIQDRGGKKREQEALRNPIIQKILETFNGKIVAIKTDL